MRDGSKAVKSAVEEVDHLNGDRVAKMTNRREGRPSKLKLRITRVRMASPRETEEMEDGIEESWHDASEDGWETVCEEVVDGAATERKEMRVGAEGSGSEVNLAGDPTGRHSDSDGERSGYGSFDRGEVRHEAADTEEGAEGATLFYMRRKIGQAKAAKSERR